MEAVGTGSATAAAAAVEDGFDGDGPRPEQPTGPAAEKDGSGPSAEEDNETGQNGALAEVSSKLCWCRVMAAMCTQCYGFLVLIFWQLPHGPSGGVWPVWQLGKTPAAVHCWL